MKRSITFALAFSAGLVCATPSWAGSLWSEKTTNQLGMYADKRASKVGDIITIVVDDNITASNSLDLTTSRTASTGTGNVVANLVNQFLTAIPNSFLGKNRFTSALTKNNVPVLNPNTAATSTSTTSTTGTTAASPTIDISGNSDYKGGGSITNKQSITARTSVTVIDVLPNGNMVVEGVRVLRYGGETTYASLRGVLRPADIQKDNTILSSQLADAQVEFASEGTLSEAQKKGWLLKLANKVNPY